jgi:hypothetical protein
MDIQTLTRNIQDLQAHFTHLQKLSPRTLKAWCVHFSENLSEQELELAVDRALINYGCNHDLSAKELVELAKGSDKAAILDRWAKTLEAIANNSLVDLDDATQYAITQLGGMSYLGSLPNATLQGLSFPFQAHVQKYWQSPPKEFERPVVIIPREQIEFKPDGKKPQLSEEQKLKNQQLLNDLIATKMSKNLNGAK